MRAFLYEAAQVMITRVKKWSSLKAWAMNVARRQGPKKAIVAWPVGWRSSCIASGSMAPCSVGQTRPCRQQRERRSQYLAINKEAFSNLSYAARWKDVLRGTMDEVSSLGLLYRSRPGVIRTSVRLDHLVLLVPCWESQGADPEEKRGPAKDIRCRAA